jgi:hypothetical protein
MKRDIAEVVQVKTTVMKPESTSSPLITTNTSINAESSLNLPELSTDHMGSVELSSNHVDHNESNNDISISQPANDLTINRKTSQRTAAGAYFHCRLFDQGCKGVFRSQKDLDRHTKSKKHDPNLHGRDLRVSNNTFRCTCKKKTPRRDNHKRHVRGCREIASVPFRCDKRHEFSCKKEYLDHLDDPSQCGKRRGRPKQGVELGYDRGFQS